MFKGLSRHLYLRIWLAVVAGVAVLMLVVAWFWRASMAHNTPPPMPLDWVIMTPKGEVLGTSAPRHRPDVPLHFDVVMPDGRELQLQIQRKWEEGRPPPHLHRTPPWWAAPPYGFFWMLGLMGLAVALGLYPVVRRLTQRLEGLQRGVQRWGEGDLTVRVPVQGNDEVADLSLRFNDAAARIEGLMASQKSLLANASHELRSPLARIRIGLELMEVANSDEALHQRTRQEILRNMAELDQLIDEILLASRLDAREADMGTVEAVDLVGLCAEECARVGAVLDVPEGMHTLEVQGVPKLLRRMVRNLLENARRYGAVNRQDDGIVLSLRVENPQVVLKVCDRGPGVPSEYRDRLFEPFFRLPGAGEHLGGVGLGLALVRSIAARHGGQVSCLPRERGGLCFEVLLSA